MLDIVNEFLTNYLAPASAVMASIVAYTAVYKNSEPQLIAYYHPPCVRLVGTSTEVKI